MQWVNGSGVVPNPQPTPMEILKIRLNYAELHFYANPLKNKDDELPIKFLIEAVKNVLIDNSEICNSILKDNNERN